MLFDPFRLDVRGHVVLVTPPSEDLAGVMLNTIKTIWNETPWVGSSLMDDKPADLEYELSLIRKYRDEQECVMFCLMYDGKYVGNFSYHKGSRFWCGNQATLGVAILREYTGLGIATAVFPKIFECAKVHGVEIMCLSVVSSNEMAMRLYRRQGFFEYGRLPGGYRYRDGFGNVCYSDDVLMAKYLV